MCTTYWAEKASESPNAFLRSAGPATVNHVAEVLRYDFDEDIVDIRTLASIWIGPPDTVYVHCVHRRGVDMEDGTDRLLAPKGELDTLAASLCFEEKDLEQNSPKQARRIRKLDGTSIESRIPSEAGPCTDDLYVEGDKKRQQVVPFSSLCYGPLPPSDIPYLLGSAIHIRGTCFGELITKFQNHGARYLYSIDGPDILLNDLEKMDIPSMSAGKRNKFVEAFERGVQGLRLPVTSYDVFTCDSPREHSDYVRLVMKSDHVIVDQLRRIADQEYKINGWHSESMGFMVGKCAYIPNK